ncbi:hypothetical protein K0504_10060 [Neiella marina]|uniref:Uncharacterized protein n=1 Tax=Neiella holothuriorum TaxID=2870530 RepID=A0ABS7EGB4_9GAMM|nr:hypothetical protein [Neiella holothuriorum]MBW8191382.1 hypothetical protein [Neiella holothuriorum]
MAEQQNTNIRRRKVMQVNLKLASEQLYLFMRKEGSVTLGAFERIGSLIKMLANNPPLQQQLTAWVDALFEEENKELVKMQAQKDVLAKSLTVDLPPVSVPDSYQIDIEVAHPIYWRFIELIQALDGLLDEVEVLWLAGVADDDNLESARRQAITIIRRTSMKIFTVTAPGKREGGKFDPSKFIAALKLGAIGGAAIDEAEPTTKAQTTDEQGEVAISPDSAESEVIAKAS